MAKTILVTGASRGLGLACAEILLDKFGCNVVSLSRSRPAGLSDLQSKYPKRLDIVQGDVTNERDQKAAIQRAVDTFGSLDGLILNAGVVEPSLRIENMDMEQFKNCFEINFFSLVTIIKAAIPHLRESKGTCIFTSSGAATGNTTSWSAYSGTKAAMNSLCRTLAAEEPDITAVALRPGVVATDMQTELISRGQGEMSAKDYKRFQDIHAQGKLVPANVSGHVLAALAVKADKNLSGHFVNYADDNMKPYSLPEGN